jgi:hypothetical protein
MSSDFAAAEVEPSSNTEPARQERPTVLVVVRDGRIEAVAANGGAEPLTHIVVEPDDRLSAVLHAIEETGARVALVARSRQSTSPGDILGVITDREVAAAVRSTARLME